MRTKTKKSKLERFSEKYYEQLEHERAERARAKFFRKCLNNEKPVWKEIISAASDTDNAHLYEELIKNLRRNGILTLFNDSAYVVQLEDRRIIDLTPTEDLAFDSYAEAERFVKANKTGKVVKVRDVESRYRTIPLYEK